MKIKLSKKTRRIRNYTICIIGLIIVLLCQMQGQKSIFSSISGAIGFGLGLFYNY